jgi:uncharacterized membrane protein YcaP (DUF421 family)
MSVVFSGWGELLRMGVAGLGGYVTLLLLLRATGKRSLTKLTAFDFISTVALGSMVATTILSNNVPLDKAILGFVLLFGVQKLVLWLSTKSHRFRELVTAHPTLVFCRGEMLQEVMEQHQLTETEVLAAIRNHGHHSLEGIEFVIMEQDGSFSVIPRSATGAASAMADVPEFR